MGPIPDTATPPTASLMPTTQSSVLQLPPAISTLPPPPPSTASTNCTSARLRPSQRLMPTTDTTTDVVLTATVTDTHTTATDTAATATATHMPTADTTTKLFHRPPTCLPDPHNL